MLTDCGRTRVFDAMGFLRAVAADLTREHEAKRARPWAANDAPPDYLPTMLRAVVGVEIIVTGFQAKHKLSQNQNRSDGGRAGVIQGLRVQGDGTVAQEMARRRAELKKA